jgi:hypothetical protein
MEFSQVTDLIDAAFNSSGSAHGPTRALSGVALELPSIVGLAVGAGDGVGDFGLLVLIVGDVESRDAAQRFQQGTPGRVELLETGGLFEPHACIGDAIRPVRIDKRGTIGAWVEHEGRTALLTNHHVVETTYRNPVGTDVVTVAGGVDGPVLATVSFSSTRPATSSEPFIDAAVAVLRDPSSIGPGHVTINGTGPLPSLGDTVRKYGATTGATTGHVVGLQARVRMKYSFGNALLDSAILVSGEGGLFSAPGDSGAVVRDTSDRAVALHVGATPKRAGRDGVSVGHSIEPVLRHVNAKLL